MAREQRQTAEDVAESDGFSLEGMKFLRGLARNNDREWFGARKAVWERTWKRPMLRLIAEVNHGMTAYAPEHVGRPEKVMMRIYRDIRFATDKRPYKTHVAAWWGREGMKKTSGAGFYLDVSPAAVTLAAGVFMPEREQMLAIRRRIVEHHEELRRILAAKPLRAAMQEFDGNPLTRPPKGFAGCGEAMDLVVCRRWGVSATLPVEVALGPGLAREVVRRFRAAASLVAFLNGPLDTKVQRPMF